MNNSDICRETIAKLMANENINVTHSPHAKTASFDVNNRNLILPVWKDTDESVYTLLISHEVGHALYTPKEDLISVFNTRPELKSIINVVEDARIEKLIQKKYPGIKYQFKKGYMALFNNNFFGTKDRDADSYNLLDRLNIHFKVGGYGYYNLPFSIDEQQWIEKIDSCETFHDVIRTSKELYEYIKEKQESENVQPSGSNVTLDDSKSQDSHQTNSNSFTNENNNETETETQSNAHSDKKIESNQLTEQNSPQTSKPSDDDSQIESETQKSFESSVANSLIDSCREYVKLKIPNLKFSDYVIDYKIIHTGLTNYYNSKINSHNTAYSITPDKVQKFKHSVAMSVNSMANIFEMKKKASLYSRTKVDKTGQLDMTKVFSYRYNDNIFKKINVVPEGKSHGMVMFFDMSSSMDKTISSCIEQILVLCMFCKKINIPFDVYGFADSYSSFSKQSYYACLDNELKIDNTFKLRHYLSSKMTNKEYESAFCNMLSLSQSYDNSYFWGIPVDGQLNGTPLLPCILMSKNVINQFKSEYNLDIVNAIYLTDGEDTHGVVNDMNEELNRMSSVKIVIKSEKTNKEYTVKTHTQYGEYRPISENLFKIVKDETGANVISFYLLHDSIERRPHLLPKDASADMVSKFYKQNNFYEAKNHLGYDSFYIIRSKSLDLDSSVDYSELDADLDLDDQKQVKQNIKKIIRSFDKHMTGSIKNKMFLNKFIEQIA